MDIVYDAGDMINVGIELGQIEGTDLKNFIVLNKTSKTISLTEINNKNIMKKSTVCTFFTCEVKIVL